MATPNKILKVLSLPEKDKTKVEFYHQVRSQKPSKMK